MTEEENDMDEAEPSKAGDGSGKMKLAALAVVVVLLVAVPMAYLMIRGGDGGDGENGDGETQITISAGGSEEELTLEDLEDMEHAEGTSSYQNRMGNWRDLGTYKGPGLDDIATRAGGMEPGDVMTVTASDDYSQRLSCYQVYPDGKHLDIQGKIILALEFNGTSVPDWEDGPMIAVLAPDGAFSQEDYNRTAPRDDGFSKSNSGGAIWVKNVVSIEIERGVYREWSINLSDLGGETAVFTRTDFTRLDYFFDRSHTDGDGNQWSGPPLKQVVGIVDDRDPTEFNTTLANYKVKVEARHGYSKTFTANYMVSNEIILAGLVNGEPIEGKHYPLRLVSPDISKGEMVGAVANISLEPAGDAVLSVIGDKTMDHTMDDLRSMTGHTGSGGYIKTTGTVVGPHEYKGVPVKDLVGEVNTGMNYSLEVEAGDGYTMTYSSSQVNGTFATYDQEGKASVTSGLVMMLAYEETGEDELHGGPLRVVIVGDETPMTDGHFWIKDVRYLRVEPYVSDWSLSLKGVTDMQMDRQSFESLASCERHRVEYEFSDDGGEHEYTGIPLWTLISAVDGADTEEGHFMYNHLLAQMGYNISVEAEDGYTATFHSSQVYMNDSIIVVFKLDGDPLPEDEFPLKIVGPELSGEQKVKMIKEISMEDIPATPEWTLTLEGESDMTMSAESFAALFYCGVHTEYHNYTDGNETCNYAGIPLWILVGAVDDGPEGDHWTLNDTLVDGGYDVTIYAGDGFNTTFSAEDVAYNSSIIVAFNLNGELLPEGDGPLRLVGPDLGAMQRIKNIVRIAIG